MIPSRRAAPFWTAAFLAVCAAFSFAENSPNAAYLRQAILEENNPHAAANFLANKGSVQTLKDSDPALYRKVFQRAAELKDLEGVLGGMSDARSIRLGLRERPNCLFCLDPVAFPAWAKKHMPYLGKDKFAELDAALWSWDSLSKTQKQWVKNQNKASAWPTLGFFGRHSLMREWAIGEHDALLKRVHIPLAPPIFI